MPNKQSLPPPEPETSNTNPYVPGAFLSKELEELVSNDTEAPYLARRHQTSFFFMLRWLKAGGHFPAGVTFFTLAILSSVAVLCSETSTTRTSWENLSVVTLFMGAALVSQIIYTNRNS